jgi:hypothetical protein
MSGINHFKLFYYAILCVSKRFYDTSIGAATGAAHCGPFVGEDFGLLVASYG